MLAPLDTVINTFGGRWFDENWNAQLDSPEVQRAVQFYVDTVREHGETGASSTGFSECATLLAQGHTAMWYDSTAAVSVLEDPDESDLVGKIGYARPDRDKPDSGWLYTWSLGIPKASDNPDAAWKFVSWMTSKDYMHGRRATGLGAGPSGQPACPPTRSPSTRRSRSRVRPTDAGSDRPPPTRSKPTVQPVPYTGMQFVAIPEFQDLGTRVSQQISAAIAGQKRGRRARPGTAVRRGRRQDLPGEVMTVTANRTHRGEVGRRRTGEDHAKRGQRLSRAEGWRRRGPLLPALIFMIVVTQIPFLFTLYYSTLSWNLVRPGSRHFVGLQNYIAVFSGQPVLAGHHQHVVLIVGVVIISVFLGLLLALLLDRAFLGPRRGPHAADHPVPGHSRCGGADLEDHHARPDQRHGELGAGPGRDRPGRLDRPVPADHR